MMERGERIGLFEEIVLLVVARLEGEGYGLSILREIEACTGSRPAIGAVYATLERLEDKGWITSFAGEATPKRGGRAKRHYRIELRGARALQGTRRLFDRLWDGLDLGRSTR